jgi:D-glycero-alpha-D-manno-heptose-7-phosphate kinase
MPQANVSIKKLLEKNPITTSAPCRIDSGGTWDIKSLALPLEGAAPITVNLAISLRTYVTLLPYKSGWIRITSDNFDTQEAYPLVKAPFNSQFGLFFAIASFFGFHGLEIKIRSTSPVNAGLGGSSTAAVATVKAFSAVKRLLNGYGMKNEDILHLAYHLEDAVNGGMCGMQDQGAAVFGGVNKWSWNYSNRKKLFLRESILDENGQSDISKRILVAYSGRRHLSARINRLWIEKFLQGETRSGWIEANKIVNRFALHIKERRWNQGAQDLIEEVAVRKKLTPEAFTPIITQLIEESEKAGCGARFTGAGGGGTVWALGEIDVIPKLREIWAHTLKGTKTGRILECSVDPIGVSVLP